MSVLDEFEQPYASPPGCLAIELLAVGIVAAFLLPSHREGSISFLLVGIAFIVLGSTVETRIRITCTSSGFAVATKRRFSKTRCAIYEWHDVRETRYREIKRAAYFAVYTNDGRAFEVRKDGGVHFAMEDFDALIGVFNAMTNHLPYIWHWQGPGSTRMWRYGFDRYHKIERDRPREEQREIDLQP